MAYEILKWFLYIIGGAFGIAIALIVVLWIINYILDLIQKPKQTASESWEWIKKASVVVGRWIMYIAIFLAVMIFLKWCGYRYASSYHADFDDYDYDPSIPAIVK